MNKERLVAFTDAIVAIAATIMVLELHTPITDDWQGLREEWPTFLAYLISFSVIYVVWYNHHNLFAKAEVVTTRTFLLNGLWLFFLTLVPFTTGWVGSAVGASHSGRPLRTPTEKTGLQNHGHPDRRGRRAGQLHQSL